MISDGDIFELAGPSYLTHIDWENPFHCRAVAACLTKAVYVLEQGRQSDQGLARRWWGFANFELLNILIDDADSSIFGAIFKNNSVSHWSESAPSYIIAFRGTINERSSRTRDLSLDLQVIFNTLDKSSRSHTAMEAVLDVVYFSGWASKVWLAGHSLGAAIAMLAGKNMAKRGCSLRTFLFNPPFITSPLRSFIPPRLRELIGIASSIFKSRFAFSHKKFEEDDQFDALSDWMPELFVNPHDFICSKYIQYFKHRETMEMIGAWGIERVATTESWRSLAFSAMGQDSEPLHLLPNAYLTVNMSPCPDFKTAHGLRQWWNPNFHFHTTLHLFRH